MSLTDATDAMTGPIVEAEDKGMAGLLAGWDKLATTFDADMFSPFKEFVDTMAAFAEANDGNDCTYTDVVDGFQTFLTNLSELAESLADHAEGLHTKYDDQVEQLDKNAKDSANSGELLGEA